MNRKTKLELTWPGKEHRPKLEPRILIEHPDKSYHAATRRESDLFGNILIKGDNLLALKALEAGFAGRVKCAYIDPPFNTKQAFDNYDDGLEHSLWLTLLRDRLHFIHQLMSEDGTVFVHIDDNELGYLIVVMDEIFGRKNRINVITFTQSAASGPKAINPGLVTTNNYILYYCKDRNSWRPNRVFSRTERDSRYSKFIVNRSGSSEDWRLATVREAFLQHKGHATWKAAAAILGDKLEEELTQFVVENAESVVRTARVAPKDVNEEARQALRASSETRDRVFSAEREGKSTQYFLNGEQLIFYSSKVKIIDGVRSTASPLTNLWDDLLSNNLHAEGGVTFPNGKKPEALIKRCLDLATSPGDIVLDSFAGSGTTGAVAHKMKRQWIMIEVGDHADTHILGRIRRIVEGVDQSGVTNAVGWKGGGGFRYYTLAPSLLERDRWGNWVIAKEYNAAMLAEALCKHLGFTYAPSQDEAEYWRHGQSSETDFLYVTTQSLTHEALRLLAEEVGPDRTLMICAKAFSGNLDSFPNLTCRKIPSTILTKCEWGRDDYSLNVAALPETEAEREDSAGPLFDVVTEGQTNG